MLFQPDFDSECSICGACPTVIVTGHIQPDTELCGVCFWHDRSMVDWELWNEPIESTD
jgi:hypothetical protein